MKKNAARKLVVVSVLLLCVFMAGCGCGKKKKDPATQQVLKISITPEPSPAPEPDKMDQKAVVKNGNITMVNVQSHIQVQAYVLVHPDMN